VQLASEKTRLEESLKLEHDTSANLSSGKSVSEATSRLYGELLTANSNRQKGILDMERRLEGLDNDDVIQMPTLPESAIKPKKSMLAIGAAVGTGFILLLFVFIRQALRTAKSLRPSRPKKLRVFVTPCPGKPSPPPVPAPNSAGIFMGVATKADNLIP
jgi:hypothetical protein